MAGASVGVAGVAGVVEVGVACGSVGAGPVCVGGGSTGAGRAVRDVGVSSDAGVGVTVTFASGVGGVGTAAEAGDEMAECEMGAACGFQAPVGAGSVAACGNVVCPGVIHSSLNRTSSLRMTCLREGTRMR